MKNAQVYLCNFQKIKKTANSFGKNDKNNHKEWSDCP